LLKSLTTSEAEFEKNSRSQKRAQNAFYASLLSIVPFFDCGRIVPSGRRISLGTGWAVSADPPVLAAAHELTTRQTVNLRRF